MQGSKKERRQPTRASGIGGVPVDLDWISRRVKRHLNDLERSNYTEPTSGPGAYGQVEDAEEAKGPSALGKDEDGRKRKKSSAVRQLLMYRKNLATLLDEAAVSHPPKGKYTYTTAAAPPSKFPPLQLCSVCGYKGKYGCQRCGLRYCDLGCKGIHDESRCERR